MGSVEKEPQLYLLKMTPRSYFLYRSEIEGVIAPYHYCAVDADILDDIVGRAEEITAEQYKKWNAMRTQTKKLTPPTMRWFILDYEDDRGRAGYIEDSENHVYATLTKLDGRAVGREKR
jgi:hypothetical protein